MRLRSMLLAALLALAASALAPVVAEASEIPSHQVLFEVKEFPQPGGKDFLEYACGLAVDQSGKIYVSDYYHDRVAVFSSAGAYQSSLKEVEPLDGPCGLAIDPSGDLFVNNYHRNVAEFTPPWGAGTVIDAGSAPLISPALRPTGVARDPASGRIYVDDRTFITAYEPSGGPVMSGGEPLKIGVDPEADYYGLAVSGYSATSGYLYVANATTSRVEVFDPATSTTTPVAEIDGEGAPGGGFNYLVDAALAVDPTTGHLFVLDNVQGPLAEHPESGLYEFNTEGDFRGQILPRELFDGEPSGLAVAPVGAPTTGDLYVTSGNSEKSRLFALTPTGPARTLKVALSGEGEGIVTSQPAGIRCGGACTSEFNEGASVTLTATPAAGSALAGWSVTGSAACPGTGTCTVALSSGVEVDAEFDAAPTPLARASDGSGNATAARAPAASASAAPAAGRAAAATAASTSRHHRHHRRAAHPARHAH